MTVVIDNNLPYSLAALLRKSGLEVTHLLEAHLAHVEDDALRKHFAEDAIIFLTRDNDFWVNHPPKWTVVWIALHNPKLAEIKGSVYKILTGLIPSLHQGQRVLIATDQIRIFD